MLKITFIGDIMLGRFVGDKYLKEKYEPVDRSIIDEVKKSDCCIANLESPIVSIETDDSLKFGGNIDLLKQFSWVNCFSLSNNHINDFGTAGMSQTIDNLDQAGIGYNGLYEGEYTPFFIEEGNTRIAVITCADMMNYEFSDDCPFKTLRVNRPEEIKNIVSKYKDLGYMVIVFLHAGMLFSRYPNPVIKDFVHEIVDIGAKSVVVAHSHCLGGYETYKDAFIFYSLGDFLMDGASFRRRIACVLQLDIEKDTIVSWKILPTQTGTDLITRFLGGKQKQKYVQKCQMLGKTIERKAGNYIQFYRWQYKLEMLSHSFSTLSFELKKRGLFGFIKIMFIRAYEIKGIVKRVFTNRSKMSYDADAVGGKRKHDNKDIA